MGHKPNGFGAGNKLRKRRAMGRLKDKNFKRKLYRLKMKSDPLRGSSQAKAIVLSKVQIEAKQPNSAMRKCAKVQLTKNGRKITAFLPRDNAQKFVNEHDEVIVECIGGKMGRAKGDIPGVRWQVIKVNDQSLNALIRGKIEKGRR